MNTAFSYTYSDTDTYTETRARYVMRKAYTDIMGLVAMGHLNREIALGWIEELLHLMDLRSLGSFQVKITGSGQLRAIEYSVQDDGRTMADDRAGGVGFGEIPSNSHVSIVINLRETLRKQEALNYLFSRGWGTGGSFLEGDRANSKTYSSGGFGLSRATIGFSND